MLRPQIETEVLLAWVQRKRAKPYCSSIFTDGTVLRDSFGILAQWSDQTRIVLNEARAGDRSLDDIEAFLAYWCRFYVIGVSRGEIEMIPA